MRMVKKADVVKQMERITNPIPPDEKTKMKITRYENEIKKLEEKRTDLQYHVDNILKPQHEKELKEKKEKEKDGKK